MAVKHVIAPVLYMALHSALLPLAAMAMPVTSRSAVSFISAGTSDALTAVALPRGHATRADITADAVNAAYNLMFNHPADDRQTDRNLIALTPTPAIYKFANFAENPSTFSQAQSGDDDAVFVFETADAPVRQPGSKPASKPVSKPTHAATSATNLVVYAVENGQDDGVFWHIASTIANGRSQFAGNFIVDTSVMLEPFAQLACQNPRPVMAQAPGIRLSDSAAPSTTHGMVIAEPGCAGGFNGAVVASVVPEPPSIVLMTASLVLLAGLMHALKRSGQVGKYPG